MEAILTPASPDQSISPLKQIRNPRKENRPLISPFSENIYCGLLHAPPPSLSFSFPPTAAAPPLKPQHRHHNHRRNHHHHHLTRPSLLPLPIPNPHHNMPPASKRINRSRSQSLSPDKSKPSVAAKRPDLRTVAADTANYVLGSVDRIGPEPSDLPRDVSRVFLSSLPLLGDNVEGLEKFSGSVFTLSPHPSSLPLPRFSVRENRSCKVDAAGVDAGATDNLRRILRLR